MNGWQRFWMMADDARIVVRVMLLLKFFALVAYVYWATHSFHGVVMDALYAEGSDWTQISPVLAAVTAFYGITVPVLSNMYLKAWTDYRASGTDWDEVQKREALGDRLAEADE